VLDFNAADREVELDGRCEEDLFESASLIVSAFSPRYHKKDKNS